MNASQTMGAIAAALAKAQGEFPVIPKDKTATIKSDKGSYSYDYADLASVIGAVTPALAKNGIAVVQSVATEGKRAKVTTRLVHSSGEWIEGEPVTLEAVGGKPQDLGGVITYARRYALGAMLGVAPEADDDANASQGNHAEVKAKPRAAQTSNADARAAVQKATDAKPSPVDAYKIEALKEATALHRGDDLAAKKWIKSVRGDPEGKRPWADKDVETVKQELALLRARVNQTKNGSGDEWGLESNP